MLLFIVGVFFFLLVFVVFGFVDVVVADIVVADIVVADDDIVVIVEMFSQIFLLSYFLP